MGTVTWEAPARELACSDSASALRAVVREYHSCSFAVDWPFFDYEFAHHQLLVDLGLRYLLGKPGTTVLDIGTGRGIVPRFFAGLGSRSITLDNPVTGGKALEFAALAGVEAHACDCTSERFPVASDSVDCVYLSDVIEHLPHSPKFVLDEIYRVLRPGGALIDSTVNSVRLTVRLKVLLGYSNWPRVGDYYDVAYHGGHHHEYTEQELRYVHERAGLRNVAVEYRELHALHAGDGLSSLQSGLRDKRSGKRRWGLVRKGLYSITRAFPGLRSQMYLVAQK